MVATLHPDATFEKVAFDPWMQTTFDVNDTATFDPKSDADVGDFFAQLPDADYFADLVSATHRRRARTL